MKKILIIFIAWFILLMVINKISTKFLKDNTSYELPKNIKLDHRFWIVPWLNFDGRNYLEIVVNGYQSKMQKNDLRVFFPFYPLLITILSLNKLINPVIVGLVVSLISFLLSLFIFDKLMVQDKMPENKRLKILILLLLFPTSFFFGAFFTESIFLLLSLLVFYFLNKKKILEASIFTALAGATRIVGLTLIPSVIWEAFKRYKETKKFPFSILLTPIGYIFFSLYLQMTTGNGFSIITMQKNWQRNLQPLGIFYAFKDGFLKIIYQSTFSKNNLIIYSVEIFEFFCALLILSVLIFGIKKIKFNYWLYLFFSSILVFSTGVLASVPRYLLSIFPIFIFLVKVLPKFFYYLICIVFLLMLVYCSFLFLRGYWVA